jgi:uncharacterized membrane protein
VTNPPPPPPPSDGGYPPPSDGGYPPPQGGYPPQPPRHPQGGYPPPPQGGYPPPPQGGYGAPPPQAGYGAPQGGYPQPGAYGSPQAAYGSPQGAYGGGQGVDIGATFSWAWNKFSKNAVALIVPTLVYGLIVAAVSGIFYWLAFALAPNGVSSYDSSGNSISYSFSSGFGFASYLMIFLGGVATFIVVGAVSSAYYAGLLDIANGQPVTIGSFFRPRNVGSVLVASLLIGVVSSLLSFCFIFSLVISLFTLFTTVLIVDRNLAPIDAIKESFAMVKANFGPVILAWLIIGVIVTVSALLCGVGVLVGIPVAALFLVHAYRTLSNTQVAPLTP